MTLVAGSLALLISAGAPGVNAQEPVAGQCFDPQLCPIPYVRLAKQETEPFLFFGKVVDEDHPRYGDYGRALRRFPDVRSCLIVSEREKPQPDLRQIDWDAIQDIREIEVCVFRIASSTEDVETVQRWLEYHQFTKVSTRSIYHNNYVPENEDDPVFELEYRLSIDLFRTISRRTWVMRMIGYEIGRSYDIYIYFSQNGRVAGVISDLNTKWNE